jgi:hypothetical protein
VVADVVWVGCVRAGLEVAGGPGRAGPFTTPKERPKVTERLL